MPRVLLNKQMNMGQYLSEWIIVQLHRKKITQTALAKEMNVTRQCLNKKLSNNQYSFNDFIAITKFLQATDEDLIKLTKI